MKILQVSTAEIGGGAERVAWCLYDAYRRMGHRSWLAVGRKTSDDPNVLHLSSGRPNTLASQLVDVTAAALDPVARRSATARSAQRTLRKMPDLPRWVRWQLGIEEFDFPSSRHLLEIPPERPDVVHCHNLHGQILPRGGYFDLRILPSLSQQVPVVLTLHDNWMLSGHCAYTLGCERWRTGCGRCPDLTLYPAIRRDRTAFNWRRKRAIYRESKLYVATPSRWLMGQVEESILASAVRDCRVIPNGVDLSIFRPADQSAARDELGIPREAAVLLFVANGIRGNVFKDFPTVRRAFEQVSQRVEGRRLILIALGDSGETERLGRGEIRYMPFQGDQTTVARHYQAADAYVHAARADTFPTVILEALACGKPVVATAVGGIAEQIDDGQTGFLVPPGDASAMAKRIETILVDESLRAALGVNAAETARRHFDLRQQTTTYLSWYASLVESSATAQTESPIYPGRT